MPVTVNRSNQGKGSGQSSRSLSGKAEVSQPLTIVIVIVAVLLIGGLGYWFINREPTKPAGNSPAAAAVGSISPTGGNATGSQQQAGAQGGLTPNN